MTRLDSSEEGRLSGATRVGRMTSVSRATGFLPGIFFSGAKSIVMQISFVMLIFLLFSDQISGGTKVSEGVGGKLPQGGAVEESQ